VAYDNATAMWERTGGEDGVPPVLPEIDADIFAIQVGKELGIPATEVEDLPEYWKGTVRTLWAWQDLERERDRRRSARKSKTSPTK